MAAKKKPAQKKPAKRKTFKQWKKPSSVQKLSFDLFNKLGEGSFGRIYRGKLKLKGGQAQRVAVKVFKSPLSLKDRKIYTQAIKKLSAAGVPLPKMGFVKHPEHGWVLVSQAFIKGKVSKLGPYESPILSLKQSRELVDLSAKTLNAGYPFSKDLFGRTKTGIVPFDIDMQVQFKPFFDRNPKKAVRDAIEGIESFLPFSARQKIRLLERFARALKPSMQSAAEKEIKRLKKVWQVKK